MDLCIKYTLKPCLFQFFVSFQVLQTYGLIGYLRIATLEHRIVESKPDNATIDLRIANPFPELQEYVDSFDLSSLDSYEFGHVPYVVILRKTAQEWISEV